jgi:hypothetical protein
VEFEQVAENIELPDNSGRHRMALRPRRLSADCFFADVRITSESVEGDSGSALTLKSFSISRDQFIRLDKLLISAAAVLIVDQSCMRLFHEGVAGWLNLGRAAAG